jgi:hypothetical protein
MIGEQFFSANNALRSLRAFSTSALYLASTTGGAMVSKSRLQVE